MPTDSAAARTAQQKQPSGFTGFKPGAYALLRDLESNQNVEWFKQNEKRYERLVRAPMLDLLKALDARFEVANISLREGPRSVLPVSLDRRPHDTRPRYRTSAVAIMSATGERRSFESARLDFGATTTRLAVGFHHVDLMRLRAVAASLRDYSEDWARAETVATKAGLSFGKGLAASVEAALAGSNGGALMARAELSSHLMAAQRAVDQIYDLVVAAVPFLVLGSKHIRDVTPQRSRGVNSLDA